MTDSLPTPEQWKQRRKDRRAQDVMEGRALIESEKPRVLPRLKAKLEEGAMCIGVDNLVEMHAVKELLQEAGYNTKTDHWLGTFYVTWTAKD